MSKTIFTAVFLAFVVGISFAAMAEDQAPAKDKKYTFSSDWVNTEFRLPDWNRALQEFKGKKNVHGLEIGSFEGRSAIWLLENILTDPSSTLTCIDLFPPEYSGRFDANLKASGAAGRLIKLAGYSDRELRKLKPDTYDFIYVDGCHSAFCVYLDAALSWDLLRVGGVMIFDDYVWNMKAPMVERPKVAIDAFIESFAPYIQVFEHTNSHTLVIKKVLDSRERSEDVRWYKQLAGTGGGPVKGAPAGNPQPVAPQNSGSSR